MQAMASTLTGSELGGLIVGPLLAEGGMGSVYQAYRPGTSEALALKVMLPDNTDDQELRERFMRETRVMRSLEHPNIMPVYESGEDNGILYFVMPLVRGPSVFELLERRRFSPLTAWQILSPAAQALHYAHSLGVIHRDIKPGNLLVEARGEKGNHVYLVDFGLSKMTGAKTLTRTGVTLGTPHYMAPEQVLGKTPTPQTDIYSLGVVLYELLLGRLPFVAKEMQEIAFKHVNDAPPAPRKLRPDFPKPLERVLQQALEKKPSNRFETAGEFRIAYARAVEEIDSVARRVEYWADPIKI